MIDANDLRRLRQIALRSARCYFATRRRHLLGYLDRVAAVALVQGAAQHYAYQHWLVVDEDRGVNDFDVLILFRQFDDPKLAAERIYRTRPEADFGDPKFGRHSSRDRDKVGRSVDILLRATRPESLTPEVVVREYLMRAGGSSPAYWRQRPVVLLGPDEALGRVLLPDGSVASTR